MTVVSQTTRVRYSGTSVPAEEYPVTFTFDYAADLEVIHTDSSGTDTTLELTTHYTVSGGSGSTGTVTVTDSDYRAGTGEALTIRLNLDIEQQTDLVDNAALSASVLETQFDRNVRVSQQLQEQIDRCVKVGVTSETDPDDLVNIIETSVVSCAASASAASSSASSASDYADAAAAYAASVDLPALEASSMLVSTSTPEWEMQTFAEVLTTLGGGSFGIDMFKAATSGAGAALFGLGSGAYATVGSGAGDLVALISNAKLPAYDGSDLTGITSGADLYFSNSETFTPAETGTDFTVPAGVTEVIVEVISGGGGGGGCGGSAPAAGGGGGGGAFIRARVTGLTPASNIAVTVGTGGTAGNATGTNGGTGGTSSFGSHVTCTGGAGGTGAVSSGGGNGSPGRGTIAASNVSILKAEAYTSSTTTGYGGNSAKGFGGLYSTGDAVGLGAGGGGGQSAGKAGDAGNNGEVIIYWQ